VKIGHNVTVLDDLSSGYEKNLKEVRDEVKLVKLDVSSKDVDSYIYNQDLVFHLAAIPDPRFCDEHIEETFKSNVDGTFNILASAVKNGVKKVVYLSTAHMYGEPKYLPIDENHPVQASNYYTLSKKLGENICSFFMNRHGLNIVYFRLFNTYGPRQRPNFIIPTLISQALRFKRIEIWSEKPSRDFLYIDDTVEALVRSIDTNFVGGPINLGYGSEVRIDQIAKLVAFKLNSELVVLNKEVSGPTRLFCNNSKAQEIFRWKPKVGLAEGLEYTINWYRQNLDYFEGALEQIAV